MGSKIEKVRNSQVAVGTNIRQSNEPTVEGSGDERGVNAFVRRNGVGIVLLGVLAGIIAAAVWKGLQ